MKTFRWKNLVLFVVLLVLFVFFVTPSLIPFISDSTREVIETPR